MKRTRLRPVSTGQRQRDAEFKRGAQTFGPCELCGLHARLDADHIQRRTRRPDLRDDPSNRRMICRSCHVRVTETPDVEGETYEKARTTK